MYDNQFQIPKVDVLSWDPNKYVTVDVRSPGEYQEFSMPSSINLPIFDNDERSKVGTVYKQMGKEEAIRLGLDFFSKKIQGIFDLILNLRSSYSTKRIVIVCARGGMRSNSVVSTLNMLGIDCLQLDGGIRAYRENITTRLQTHAERLKFYYVLSGNTGTKKTDVLRRLKLEGYPVIDLEDLASHRGSAFGGIGLKSRSQKEFELLLVGELDRYYHSPYLLIESESKRIGNIVVPDFIMAGKRKGVRIELEYPFMERVQHLLETYQPNNNQNRIIEAFLIIKKRMQKHVGNEIHDLLLKRDYEKAFVMLLTHYYDPRYDHSMRQEHQEIVHVNFTDIYDAVAKVKQVIADKQIDCFRRMV
ncbi:tRNA 2-selenouridine(34) synthase MnmH [Anaerobacillus alkaliphilus]|nr:tRNA 2-selenouridine(34) synthase MnmH [Anaerobacillus alkaliphilus]